MSTMYSNTGRDNGYMILRNFLIVYVVYINSYIHGCSMYTYLYIHALLVFTQYIETCVLFCVLLPLSICCSQYLQNRIQTNKMEHVVNVTFHSPCFFLIVTVICCPSVSPCFVLGRTVDGRHPAALGMVKPL